MAASGVTPASMINRYQAGVADERARVEALFEDLRHREQKLSLLTGIGTDHDGLYVSERVNGELTRLEIVSLKDGFRGLAAIEEVVRRGKENDVKSTLHRTGGQE